VAGVRSTWDLMTPSRSEGVTQTILPQDPDGRVGNCLQAAVATVLWLPLQDVPHFAAAPDWRVVMNVFLRTRGYEAVWESRDVWNGLAFGMTRRGWRHAVAVVDGEVWDPHPARMGLIRVDTRIEIVPSRMDYRRPMGS
jgi:hypothetical protein